MAVMIGVDPHRGSHTAGRSGQAKSRWAGCGSARPRRRRRSWWPGPRPGRSTRSGQSECGWAGWSRSGASTAPPPSGFKQPCLLSAEREPGRTTMATLDGKARDHDIPHIVSSDWFFQIAWLSRRILPIVASFTGLALWSHVTGGRPYDWLSGPEWLAILGLSVLWVFRIALALHYAHVTLPPTSTLGHLIHWATSSSLGETLSKAATPGTAQFTGSGNVRLTCQASRDELSRTSPGQAFDPRLRARNRTADEYSNVRGRTRPHWTTDGRQPARTTRIDHPGGRPLSHLPRGAGILLASGRIGPCGRTASPWVAAENSGADGG